MELRLGQRDVIDKKTYESRYADITSKITNLTDEEEQLMSDASYELETKKRIDVFRGVFESKDVLEKFDRVAFESIISRVHVGGVEESGATDSS